MKIVVRINFGLGFWSKEYVIGKCFFLKLILFLLFRVMEVGGLKGVCLSNCFCFGFLIYIKFGY